ncbi:MAG: HAD family hydrolase [Acidobacteriaceae bacterium]|nr:HAD family hydrolase [Acidobacteriaceae bacterium]
MKRSSDLPWLPRASEDFNLICRHLLQTREDLGLRIKALAGSALDFNQLEKLCKVIRSAGQQGLPLAPLAPVRMGLLSNSTSDFVRSAITATAPRFGLALDCPPASYGQVVQEAMNPDAAVFQSNPAYILVALDWRGLPLTVSPGASDDAAVQSAMAHFEAIRAGIRANSSAVCIWQSLPAPADRLFGSFDRVLTGTRRRLIDKINAELAEMVRNSGGVLLDVAGIAETVGLENWNSPREWHLAKLPFAQEYLPLYADHVCRTVAALAGTMRRCLVLDLDNTLWGGVIGDDGLQGIACSQGDAAGEAFLEFQQYVWSLRQRGIVLAVSSKNEENTARLPFREHPEMILKEDHFAVFRANWDDKAANIQAIAEELALGLESLVFVDDNPFERDLVRRMLPQVAVPEMPDDPALYTTTLSAAGYFEALAFSDEDAKRADFYAQNRRRASLQKSVTDLESYLASLQMEISFRPFDAANRARIVQLINKSNQFNLTTRRYTEPAVQAMEDLPGVFTMQVRLRDSFGDNGVISLIICKTVSETEWEIDTWVMSCRVLGRRVEDMVLREIVAHAREAGIQHLLGCYLPTERNALVKDHYAKLGFKPDSDLPQGGSVWRLNVADAVIPEAPMVVHSEGFRPSHAEAVVGSTE